MDDAKKDSDQGYDKTQQPEVTFSVDGNVGEAVGQGMDALKMVLGGIVNMAQELVGPEGMRNFEASQWLAQAGASIEEVANGIREQGAAPAGKGGEITCFLERVDAELKGSKFESQIPSFRQRLNDTLQFIERTGDTESSAPDAQDINRLADSAGYFHAAAASVAPLSNSTGDNDPPEPPI